MQLTIDETNRRREKQISYNAANGITPTQIRKKIENTLAQNTVASYNYIEAAGMAAEDETKYLSKSAIEKRIKEKKRAIEKAAKALDFIVAAQLRDEIKTLKEQLN